MADRYGRDPRMIGWQIDNEFGGGKTARCYCAACATGFRRWLRDRYLTLDALNEAWGTVFLVPNLQQLGANSIAR
jgi:beta-galactosidase